MNRTKAAWLQATKEAQDFIAGHTGPWTSALDSEYLALRNRALDLYYEWQAEVTGKSAEDIAYAVTESVHSRYD